MKPQSMIVFATKTKYIHPPGMFLSGNRIVPWLPMLSSVLKIFSISSKNNPTYDYASISGDWLNCPGILFSLRNIQIELKIEANSKILKKWTNFEIWDYSLSINCFIWDGGGNRALQNNLSISVCWNDSNCKLQLKNFFCQTTYCSSLLQWTSVEYVLVLKNNRWINVLFLLALG